jgi:hypothetical protein
MHGKSDVDFMSFLEKKDRMSFLKEKGGGEAE